MKSSLRIPHPHTTLGLYRHILRESSYLPPVARSHIDRLIKTRVRKLQHADDAKAKRQIREGHHKLRMLRAANGGDLVRMQRVLSFAFGRRGKRRRELWDKFMYPEPPTTINQLLLHPKRPADVAPAVRKPDFLDRWDQNKLLALLRSQATHLASLDQKRIPVNAPGLNIPKESVWGLPLVPELERAKLRREWVELAEKALPPVPRPEWELLRDIVNGRASKELTKIPQRRPVAVSQRPDHGPVETEWHWASPAIKPVTQLDSQASRRNRLLSGAVDENTPTGPPPVIGCHNLTPRVWKRLFLGIWQRSAYMDKNPDNDKWVLVWGRLAPHSASTSKSVSGFITDAKTKGEYRKPAPKQQGRKRVKPPSDNGNQDTTKASAQPLI